MMTRPDTGSLVVRYVATRAVPFILLFSLAVLGHGEDGPGGGFQGGVIFGAGYILYALVHGWGAGRDRFPEPVSDALMPAGAMLYASIGVVTMLLGGAFLEYGRFAVGDDPHAIILAHELGLTGIEIGVMITVSASMVTLFFEMARPKVFISSPHRRREVRHASEEEPT